MIETADIMSVQTLQVPKKDGTGVYTAIELVYRFNNEVKTKKVNVAGLKWNPALATKLQNLQAGQKVDLVSTPGKPTPSGQVYQNLSDIVPSGTAVEQAVQPTANYRQGATGYRTQDPVVQAQILRQNAITNACRLISSTLVQGEQVKLDHIKQAVELAKEIVKYTETGVKQEAPLQSVDNFPTNALESDPF